MFNTNPAEEHVTIPRPFREIHRHISSVPEELSEEEEKIKKDLLEKSPMINTTEHQIQKLNPGLRLKAQFFTHKAYWWEKELVYGKVMQDLLNRDLVYVPYEIPEDQRMQYGGNKFMFEIFIVDNRLIRRRIEKLLKTKFIWSEVEGSMHIVK